MRAPHNEVWTVARAAHELRTARGNLARIARKCGSHPDELRSTFTRLGIDPSLY